MSIKKENLLKKVDNPKDWNERKKSVVILIYYK